MEFADFYKAQEPSAEKLKKQMEQVFGKQPQKPRGRVSK